MRPDAPTFTFTMTVLTCLQNILFKLLGISISVSCPCAKCAVLRCVFRAPLLQKYTTNSSSQDTA
eukprot:4045-Heterococcus_DN1.PRE.2